MRQPDSLTEDGVKQFRQQGYWQGRLFVDLIDSHATVAPDKIAIRIQLYDTVDRGE